MHDTPAFERHIVAPGDIAAHAALLPRPLVFTNGVFDILHRGHVTYLAQARALGASLIVALNSDASAKRLGKGADRPVNTLADRAAVVAALDADPAVDAISDLRITYRRDTRRVSVQMTVEKWGVMRKSQRGGA